MERRTDGQQKRRKKNECDLVYNLCTYIARNINLRVFFRGPAGPRFANDDSVTTPKPPRGLGCTCVVLRVNTLSPTPQPSFFLGSLAPQGPQPRYTQTGRLGCICSVLRVVYIFTQNHRSPSHTFGWGRGFCVTPQSSKPELHRPTERRPTDRGRTAGPAPRAPDRAGPAPRALDRTGRRQLRLASCAARFVLGYLRLMDSAPPAPTSAAICNVQCAAIACSTFVVLFARWLCVAEHVHDLMCRSSGTHTLPKTCIMSQRSLDAYATSSVSPERGSTHGTGKLFSVCNPNGIVRAVDSVRMGRVKNHNFKIANCDMLILIKRATYGCIQLMWYPTMRLTIHYTVSQKNRMHPTKKIR